LHAEVNPDSFKPTPFARLLEEFLVVKIIIIIVSWFCVENEEVWSSVELDL